MSSAGHQGGTPSLVLASTSPYRRALLERLALPFVTAAPNVDETAVSGEGPLDLVNRLARSKANAVAQRYNRSIVVGSDQMAVLGQEILGKPGSAERCIEQLRSMSGQRVAFYTAVHVIDAHTLTNQSHVDTTTVYFRQLTLEEIRRYAAHEQPYDCAGGFKVEGLGITLFDRIESYDPTALIGLPMIWLSGALRSFGVQLP